MKIDIKGPIINDDEQFFYDWFGLNATSPKKVNNKIAQAKKGEKLELFINSPGGSVFGGSEIYSELRKYNGEVEVNIVGIAASAASVIAMSGNKVLMSPTSQMMIHNAAVVTMGDHRGLTDTSEILKGIDNSIASAYEEKTGKNRAELLDLMAKETWLGLDKAKELGFVDGSMFESTMQFKNSLVRNDGTLPPEVINKLRDELVVNGKISIDNVKNKNNVETKMDSELELVKAKARAKLINKL